MIEDLPALVLYTGEILLVEVAPVLRRHLIRTFPLVLAACALLVQATFAQATAAPPAAVQPSDRLDPSACAPASSTHENLNAVLWVRTSLEYRHAAVQSYRIAALQLDRALADRSWTAALEQSSGYESLPPAIILDLDETVLDNSPAQVGFMKNDNGLFTEAGWDAWVARAEAAPVPGALRFLQLAEARGVAIFYVTNREARHHGDTIRNLSNHGFPFADDEHVLTKGEVPGWGSDKSSRRRFLGTSYRIVLLIGDDANDFLSGVRGGVDEREAAFAPYEDYLGTRWIVLPNPTYGSWENALWGGGYPQSRGQSLVDKCKAIQ